MIFHRVSIDISHEFLFYFNILFYYRCRYIYIYIRLARWILYFSLPLARTRRSGKKKWRDGSLGVPDVS